MTNSLEKYYPYYQKEKPMIPNKNQTDLFLQ